MRLPGAHWVLQCVVPKKCVGVQTATCVFPFNLLQTKIFEVLDLKQEDRQRLWVSDECTVLDAVKKVGAAARACQHELSWHCQCRGGAAVGICQACGTVWDGHLCLAFGCHRLTKGKLSKGVLSLCKHWSGERGLGVLCALEVGHLARCLQQLQEGLKKRHVRWCKPVQVYQLRLSKVLSANRLRLSGW